MNSDAAKIRVCFVMPKAYPLFNPGAAGVFGGSEVDLYYISSELARDPAFEVSFIVGDYGQPMTEQREGVRLIKSIKPNRKSPLAGLILYSRMKTAAADIYMTKTASPGVPLISLFCSRHKKNFIYRTAHKRECDGSYINAHRIMGPLFRHALKKAHCVFAQNDEDRDDLLKTIGVDSIVILNAHRLTEIGQDEKDSILWIGRTADFKKPHKFLDLAERFPAQKFVMICQKATGDNHYDAFRRRAEGIPNIEFHPRVSFHEIDAFFARARVFVNTSDSEGFPNTFIQACKWAVPILSLTVNPDDFLTRHACGLACGGDMDALAENLAALLEPGRNAELGRNARRYAEEHHDITRVIERYKEIFRSLVHVGKGRP